MLRHGFTESVLFLDSLEDDYVRIDCHTDRQDESRDTGKRKSKIECRQNSNYEETRFSISAISATMTGTLVVNQA